MSSSEVARLVVYLATFALGIFLVVYGSVTGNTELIAAGMTMIVSGGTATYNVPTIHDSVKGVHRE